MPRPAPPPAGCLAGDAVDQWNFGCDWNFLVSGGVFDNGDERDVREFAAGPAAGGDRGDWGKVYFDRGFVGDVRVDLCDRDGRLDHVFCEHHADLDHRQAGDEAGDFPGAAGGGAVSAAHILLGAGAVLSALSPEFSVGDAAACFDEKDSEEDCEAWAADPGGGEGGGAHGGAAEVEGEDCEGVRNAGGRIVPRLGSRAGRIVPRCYWGHTMR